MTVNEFVDEYKASNNRELFVKKHIVRKYVPYEEKIALCENIVKNSMYITDDDTKIFRSNLPVRYMLFTMQIIAAYTDIEIKFNNIDDFNLVEESGIGNAIKVAIDEIEFNRFDGVLKMVTDDYYENERSVCSYLDGIKILLNKVTSIIDKNLLTEEE